MKKSKPKMIGQHTTAATPGGFAPKKMQRTIRMQEVRRAANDWLLKHNVVYPSYLNSSPSNKATPPTYP